MSAVVGILLLLVAVNPPRRRSELPADRQAVAAGAGLTLVVLVALGLAGEWLLEGLSISIPSFHVAVGLVLAIRSAIDLFTALPAAGEELPGRRAALAPVFFPVLFRPEVALVAVGVAVDAGRPTLVAAAVVAMAAVVGWCALPSNLRFDRAAGVAFSAGLMVLAIDRIVDGVFAL